MKLRTHVFDWLSAHDKVIRPTKATGPIVQLDAVTCSRLISGAPVSLALRHAGLPIKGSSWEAAISGIEWWIKQDPVARRSRIRLNPRLVGAVSKQGDKISIIQLLDQLAAVWAPSSKTPSSNNSSESKDSKSDSISSESNNERKPEVRQKNRNGVQRQEIRNKQPQRTTHNQQQQQQQPQQQQQTQIQHASPAQQLQVRRPANIADSTPLLEISRTAPALVERERCCDTQSIGCSESIEAFLIGSLCRTMNVPVSQGAALLGRDPAILRKLVATPAAVPMLSAWCTYLETHVCMVLHQIAHDKQTHAAIAALRTVCMLSSCPQSSVASRAMSLVSTISRHTMWSNKEVLQPLAAVLTAHPAKGAFPHPLTRDLLACGQTQANSQETVAMLVVEFADQSCLQALCTPQPGLFQGPASHLEFMHDLVASDSFIRRVEGTNIPDALAHLALESCPAFARDNINNNNININNSKEDLDVTCQATSLLTRLWTRCPALVESNDGLANAVLARLQHAARHTDVSLKIMALANLFVILETSDARLASRLPAVFKLLIFSLFESHPNTAAKDFLISNLCRVLSMIPQIPVSALIDPFAKHSRLRGYCNLDFDLWTAISCHPNLSPSAAVQIIDLMGQIAVQDHIFGRLATVPLLLVATHLREDKQVVGTLTALSTAAVAGLKQLVYIKTPQELNPRNENVAKGRRRDVEKDNIMLKRHEEATAAAVHRTSVLELVAKLIRLNIPALNKELESLLGQLCSTCVNNPQKKCDPEVLSTLKNLHATARKQREASTSHHNQNVEPASQGGPLMRRPLPIGDQSFAPGGKNPTRDPSMASMPPNIEIPNMVQLEREDVNHSPPSFEEHNDSFDIYSDIPTSPSWATVGAHPQEKSKHAHQQTPSFSKLPNTRDSVMHMSSKVGSKVDPVLSLHKDEQERYRPPPKLVQNDIEKARQKHYKKVLERQNQSLEHAKKMERMLGASAVIVNNDIDNSAIGRLNAIDTSPPHQRFRRMSLQQQQQHVTSPSTRTKFQRTQCVLDLKDAISLFAPYDALMRGMFSHILDFPRGGSKAVRPLSFEELGAQKTQVDVSQWTAFVTKNKLVCDDLLPEGRDAVVLFKASNWCPKCPDFVSHVGQISRITSVHDGNKHAHIEGCQVDSTSSHHHELLYTGFLVCMRKVAIACDRFIHFPDDDTKVKALLALLRQKVIERVEKCDESPRDSAYAGRLVKKLTLGANWATTAQDIPQLSAHVPVTLGIKESVVVVLDIINCIVQDVCGTDFLLPATYDTDSTRMRKFVKKCRDIRNAPGKYEPSRDNMEPIETKLYPADYCAKQAERLRKTQMKKAEAIKGFGSSFTPAAFSTATPIGTTSVPKRIKPDQTWGSAILTSFDQKQQPAAMIGLQIVREMVNTVIPFDENADNDFDIGARKGRFKLTVTEGPRVSVVNPNSRYAIQRREKHRVEKARVEREEREDVQKREAARRKRKLDLKKAMDARRQQINAQKLVKVAEQAEADKMKEKQQAIAAKREEAKRVRLEAYKKTKEEAKLEYEKKYPNRHKIATERKKKKLLEFEAKREELHRIQAAGKKQAKEDAKDLFEKQNKSRTPGIEPKRSLPAVKSSKSAEKEDIGKKGVSSAARIKVNELTRTPTPPTSVNTKAGRTRPTAGIVSPATTSTSTPKAKDVGVVNDSKSGVDESAKENKIGEDVQSVAGGGVSVGDNGKQENTKYASGGADDDAAYAKSVASEGENSASDDDNNDRKKVEQKEASTTETKENIDDAVGVDNEKDEYAAEIEVGDAAAVGDKDDNE